jgi:hypothetical protein
VASAGGIRIDPLESEDFRSLCVRFSSGLTLKELCSIGAVACAVAGRPPPPRAARRIFHAMVSWFRDNWAALIAVLPSIGLADVDGRREALEKGLSALMS